MNGASSLLAFAKEFTFKGRQTAMQCMLIVGNLYSRGQLGAA